MLEGERIQGKVGEIKIKKTVKKKINPERNGGGGKTSQKLTRSNDAKCHENMKEKNFILESATISGEEK